jgi:cyclopropane fatty-acyl-phospholipid synthase-like methyltransferase
MKAFWDERYSQPEYVYGETPNVFFKSSLEGLRPGKILLPAEGEGRNAVYAASLGWQVTAFDQSEQGKQKAEALAQKHKVHITYEVGECGALSYPIHSFDAIGLIYVHFPPAQRQMYHHRLLAYLKPGGILILEAFSKNHHTFQLTNPMAGGPRDVDMLYTVEDMRHDFPGVEFTMLSEQEIELSEGQYHAGKAMVIRLSGIKK